MPDNLVSNMVRGADGKFNLPIQKPKKKEKKSLPDLKPEDPLISVNGTFITWGAMRRFAEALIANFKLPAGVTAAEFEAERDSILLRQIYKLSAGFISKTVLAQEAVRLGVHVDPKLFENRQAELVQALKKSGRNNDCQIRDLYVPGSFAWFDVSNSVLIAGLQNDIIRPSITVSNEEVKTYINKRIKDNDEITAYNQRLRPKLEGLLSIIREGKETFADVAFRESDCGSSVDYGEWGILKRENLRPELAGVAFSMKEGTLSDVIETPHSFHILKLNKINYGFVRKGDTTPPQPISVNLAHIMLEKKEHQPVLTPDEARKEIIEKRVRERISELEARLIKTTPIVSPLKLF